MLVFLGWSGEISLAVAKAVSAWIPCVLQGISTFVSDDDIEAGTRWRAELDKKLLDSNFGIICITPENLQSQWIYYEAGALGKAFGESRVVPFLFGVSPSDIIKNPLNDFQVILPNREKVLKLVSEINGLMDEERRLDGERLSTTFDMWWPKLDEALSKLHVAQTAPKKANADEVEPVSGPSADLLEEVLSATQENGRVLRSPSALLPPEYIAHCIDDVLGKHLGRQQALRVLVRTIREGLHYLHQRLDLMSGQPPQPSELKEIAKTVQNMEQVVRDRLIKDKYQGARLFRPGMAPGGPFASELYRLVQSLRLPQGRAEEEGGTNKVGMMRFANATFERELGTIEAGKLETEQPGAE